LLLLIKPALQDAVALRSGAGFRNPIAVCNAANGHRRVLLPVGLLLRVAGVLALATLLATMLNAD